jgi:hypothetical protein
MIHFAHEVDLSQARRLGQERGLKRARELGLLLTPPHDRRHGVGLDDQVLLEPVDLVHRLHGGGRVVVADRDEVSHGAPPFLRRRRERGVRRP